MKNTISKKSLLESAICTAILGLIIVGCGGTSSLLKLPGTIGAAATASIRSFTHANGSISGSSNGGRSIAAFFAVTTPSTLPESWQAGCLDLSINTAPLRYAVMTTEAGNPCGDGGFTPETRDSPTATDYPDGPAITFDGTITAIVMTAHVDGIGEVRCNDVTSSSAVRNGDHIQPWFDTVNHAVLLTSEHVVISNGCTLPGVAPGAVVRKISIKLAKQ